MLVRTLRERFLISKTPTTITRAPPTIIWGPPKPVITIGGVKKSPVIEWEKIADLTFHNLRHDFAHRAREAGWTLEEIAYYLGHITKKGTLAVQTTVRYTQVSRE